jgi:hypothetical protein
MLFLAYTFPNWEVEVELIGVSGWVAILATALHKGLPDAFGMFGQSCTMSLKPPQHRQWPSSIHFWCSSGDKWRPAAKRSIGVGLK